MKLSWNNLKISIAGAKLSHLVQKNSMWDHGSMIEQVRTVFIHLKKAFLRSDPSILKKCMTSEGYEKISEAIKSKKWSITSNPELISIEIISVVPAKHHQTDKFKALVKLKKTQEATLEEPVSFYKNNCLPEEEWLFIREGNWWLLDQVKR